MTDISLTTISIIVIHDLNMSFKRVTRYHHNRFSDYNMAYTQAFIDYIYNQDPYKLKFMDEAGVKKVHAHRIYGHATVGQKAVTISKYVDAQSHTLSLLLGLGGVCYSKIIPRASNTGEFVEFFREATDAYTLDGIQSLMPGDVIIVDNASIHHNEAERILYNYFNRMGITYVFSRLIAQILILWRGLLTK